MNSTTASAAIPYEGGTARLVQSAGTGRRGWAIGVFEWITYRGETCYFVARIGGGRFLRISEPFGTEAAARKVANVEYRKDKAAA